MMKSMEQMRAELSALTMARMGFDGAAVEQGSPEWILMRRGVITASRAKDLIATDRSGKGPGAARKAYMLELAGEIMADAEDSRGFKQTEWGQSNESDARATFAFHTGLPVHEIPFIYGDVGMRYGCSPDGIVDEYSGAEIKCPFTNAVYMDFIGGEVPKQEYMEQMQFSMFVTGAEFWHFCNYNPRMYERPFHAIIIERDEAKMKIFADAVGQMTHDLDRYLRETCKLTMRFGDHWERARERRELSLDVPQQADSRNESDVRIQPSRSSK